MIATTSVVQNAHRLAAIGISLRHSGQLRVVGSAGGSVRDRATQHIHRLDHEEEEDERDEDEGHERVEEVPVVEAAPVDRERQAREVGLAEDDGDLRREEIREEVLGDLRTDRKVVSVSRCRTATSMMLPRPSLRSRRP